MNFSLNWGNRIHHIAGMSNYFIKILKTDLETRIFAVQEISETMSLSFILLTKNY